MLPARLPGYRPQDLDLLCAAGEVVWVGVSPLGERDGRVALYLADNVALLHAPSAEPPQGAAHDAIRAHLARQRRQLLRRAARRRRAACPQDVLDALWDLVWAGEVTNDAPGALRAFLRPPSSRAPGARAACSARAGGRRASAVGRWSLVAPRRAGAGDADASALKALAEQLLARHGVLTREAVLAEGVTGGFATLYPVLKALEEAGRMRRGYFVAGLGGSQFAQPGALDRLRALRETSADPRGPDAAPPAVVLAATDPANPYGAALPWPEGVAGAMRAAGTHVVLVDGAPRRLPAAGRGRRGRAAARRRAGAHARRAGRGGGARGVGAAHGAGHAGLEAGRRRRGARAGGRAAGRGVRALRARVSVHGEVREEKDESAGPDGHGHEDVDVDVDVDKDEDDLA